MLTRFYKMASIFLQYSRPIRKTNLSASRSQATTDETMKPLFEDTSPETEEILIEGYRRMPFHQKLQCIFDLTDAARSLQLAQIRKRYPQADERECLLRLASQWLEPELMREAFGWDAEKK